MKANELRVGNWVNNNGEDYQITSATISQLEREESSAVPIPLTEEWYNKFNIDRRWFMLGNCTFCFRDNDPGDFFEVECKYVHQLQNLYFALTGEELTIKE